MNKRELGKEYEERAAAYLEAGGCRIIEKNYRCRIGEVDLIVRDGPYLAFVEVKYRRSEQMGNALEAVNQQKQMRIRKIAAFYLMVKRYPETMPCRFDVIGITADQISYIKNAF